jgi:hypothetical protein
MTRVIFDISMSLDGFVTASNVRPEEPLGAGGQRLHEWAFGEDERNRELLTEAMTFVGAAIAGLVARVETAEPSRSGEPRK